MTENDDLTNTVNTFVNILDTEQKTVTKALIDSKLLYIYLTMPKAKRKDMEKLVPFVYKVEPDAVRDELYSHYGIK
jgi:hypothetical protein